MSARLFAASRRPVRAGRRRRAGMMLAIGALLCAVTVSPTYSETPGVGATTDALSPKNVVANAMQEASRRFHVPVSWLRAVMRAESHGDAKSVSDKGAIGLMQVMPRTYVELRAKYGFGSDPFDPRDNILAGAAYLAEMFARYGSPGFLAAYNAGPRRYEEHLLGGRPLPAETTDYVARLAPELGFASVPAAGIHAPPDALRAPMFVTMAALNIAPAATADGGANRVGRSQKAAPHPLFPAPRERQTLCRRTAFGQRLARSIARGFSADRRPICRARQVGIAPMTSFVFYRVDSAFQSAFARGSRRGSASDQAMAG